MSSFSALIALQGVDISHDNDLNPLCKGFAIERPIFEREIRFGLKQKTSTSPVYYLGL